MAAQLDPERWRHRPDAAVTRAIAEELMGSLHGYGAGVVRGEIDRCGSEVPRMPVLNDLTWILGTSPRRHTGPLFPKLVEDRQPKQAPDG